MFGTVKYNYQAAKEPVFLLPTSNRLQALQKDTFSLSNSIEKHLKTCQIRKNTPFGSPPPKKRFGGTVKYTKRMVMYKQL